MFSILYGTLERIVELPISDCMSDFCWYDFISWCIKAASRSFICRVKHLSWNYNSFLWWSSFAICFWSVCMEWNCLIAGFELYVLILLTGLFLMLHRVHLLTGWFFCLEVMLNLFGCHLSLSVSNLLVLNCLLSFDCCFGLLLLSRWVSFRLYCLLLIAILSSDCLSSSSCHIWINSIWLCYSVGCVELYLLVCMSWVCSQTFICSCISSYLEVIQYLMVWLPPGPSVSDILDHTGSSLSALDSIFIFICYIKLHHACFVAITCVRYFVQQLPTLMRCCPILLKLPCPLLLVMFGMSPVWLVLISCMCHLCAFS